MASECMTQSREENWFDANPRKAKGLVFLICLLFIEGMIRLCVAAGWIPHRTYPTSREPQYWAHIDPVTGVGRFPNTEYRMKEQCIDVLFQSNSAGARDPERALESDAPRRVVVLGDSYVEGLGVNLGERFTDLLEATTAIEHVNFGSSGFGTIQEWLYYENYATRYDHTDVFLFVFPGNDFRDNDPGESGRNEYRPFLRENDGEFELYYPVAFEDRHREIRGLGEVVKNTIDNKFYIANCLRWINRLVKDETWGAPGAQSGSYYDDYDRNDLKIFLHALNNLADAVGERRLFVFTIPAARDFEHGRREGTEFALIDELHNFARQRPNVRVLDLLTGLLAHSHSANLEYADYTLGCDEHFGKFGNRVVAEIVSEFVYGD